MKRIFVFICALLLTGILAGCGSTTYDIFCSISGTISDYESGEPIPNASITMLPGPMTQLSGQDGTFTFSDLDEGQYTFSVQKNGYQPNRKTVSAISGETVEITIQLQKISE